MGPSAKTGMHGVRLEALQTFALNMFKFQVVLKENDYFFFDHTNNSWLMVYKIPSILIIYHFFSTSKYIKLS